MMAVAWRDDPNASKIARPPRGIENATFNEILNEPKRQRAQAY